MIDFCGPSPEALSMLEAINERWEKDPDFFKKALERNANEGFLITVLIGDGVVSTIE